MSHLRLRSVFRPVFLITVLLIVFGFSGPLSARSWDDLDEGEHKIFGSEKEDKYSINAFFVEKEDWPGHYSFSIFWLFNRTNYPKYTSTRVLPFFYNLSSKIDNRSRTIIPPILYFNQVDGSDDLTVSPVYFSTLSASGADRSLLYFIWWGDYKGSYTSDYRANPLFYHRNSNKNGSGSTWWAPILPLVYHSSNESSGSHTNLFWFLDWAHDSRGNFERFWVMPLWFEGDNYRHILPPLYISTKDSNGERYKHLIPLFFTDRSVKTRYMYNNNSRETIYTDSSITLLGCSFTERAGENKWEEEPYDAIYWAPIVPLIYKSYNNSSGTHWNLFWFMDWAMDKDEKLERFWVMPFWFEGPGSSGYRHILPPLYISTRNGDGELYKHLLPLFFTDRSINSRHDYSTNKRENIYTDTSVTLLGCSFTDRKGENKWEEKPYDATYWAPFVPLIFKSYNISSGTHWNLFWFIDWASDKDEELERFWAMPFWFEGPGSNGYRHILPPLYISTRYSDGELYKHLIPLFFTDRSIKSRYNYSEKKSEKIYSDSSLSLLACSFTERKGENKWDEKPYKSTIWTPIVPLYYHSYDNKGSHTNLLWFIDWSSDKDEELERLWVMPFWFEGPGTSGYRHILPPLYVSTRNGNGELYKHLLPLFFTDRSIKSRYNYSDKKSEKIYTDSSISLLASSFTERKGDKKWDEEPYKSTIWTPIVPLYYHSYDNRGSHSNLFWIFDWGRNRNNKLTRFWMMPLLFEGKDYRLILPPLYINLGKNSSTYYRHLLPFYGTYRRFETVYDYSSTEKKETLYKDSSISLLACSLTSRRGTAEEFMDQEPIKAAYWFPIVPLYYYSYDEKTGSHRNLFWMFDWAHDSVGDLERFWMMPLVFHKRGEGGYRVYAPFYFRPSGWTNEEGLSFGPLHYNSWSPEEDTTWSLLYYSHKEYAANDTAKINPESYYTHFFPLYWAWKSEESKGKIFLPFSIEYEDDDDYVELNCLAISKSSLISPVTPSIGFDIGQYKGKWYWDTDISWLYNMISFSNRTIISDPTKKNEVNKSFSREFRKEQEKNLAENTADTIPVEMAESSADAAPGTTSETTTGESSGTNSSDIAVDNAEDFFGTPDTPIDSSTNDSINSSISGSQEETDLTGTPHLSRKREFDREHSSSFFGWKVLFGLMAYERGDTKRHFRLLPLSYLTWDTESEDRVFVLPVPPIISYQSEQDKLGYLVIFPFFGGQYDNGSYSRAYLVNLFWDEYDIKRKWSEQSILWPFFNCYDSPNASGWRIFPLFWHKWNAADTTETSKNISFLHYNRHTIDKESGKTLYNKILNPFIYYKDSNGTEYEEEYSQKGSYFTVWSPLLPIFSYSNEKIFSGADSHQYAMDKSSFLFPLYYWSEEIESTYIEGKEKSDFMLIGLPFLYYRSIKTPAADDRTNEDTLFLLGFYYYNSPVMTKSHFLGGLFSYENLPLHGSKSYKLLYGLFGVTSMNGYAKSHILPLYYYNGDPREWELALFMGLYNSSGYNKRINPRFGSTSYTVDSRVSKHWLIPLFYYKGSHGPRSKETNINKNTVIAKSPPYSAYTFFSPLWYRDYESIGTGADTQYTSSFWFPLIPLVYRYADNSRTHWNFLWLIDNNSYNEEVKNYNRFFFLPFIYTRSDDSGYHTNILGFIDWEKHEKEDRTDFWVLPIVSRHSGYTNHLLIYPLLTYIGTSPEETSVFCLGTYWNYTPQYEYQNILYLFEHRNIIEQEMDSYYLAMRMAEYTTSPEITRFRLAWGLLASYEGKVKSSDFDFSILQLLVTARRDGGELSHSVLPLYYYKQNPGSWSLLSPATLSYFSKDKDGDFDLGLLGLAYYRNNKISEGYDRRMWLLGTLYDEVKRPERGYHFWGSFWGLLWGYETEDETGYKKFSILKGLYKQVQRDNRTKNTFLWVITI
ncbi:MAG: hypothetical protein GY754_20750 [bacterium]|nr:hypothetical protein [bacterium]